jgi:hypothetical protein
VPRTIRPLLVQCKTLVAEPFERRLPAIAHVTSTMEQLQLLVIQWFRAFSCTPPDARGLAFSTGAQTGRASTGVRAGWFAKEKGPPERAKALEVKSDLRIASSKRRQAAFFCGSTSSRACR